jgi:Cd2+/Zn2+-exporting ATPase
MVLLVGFGARLIGAITLADEIRPETKGAIARLKELGVKKFVMLTGDNESVAAKVAVQIGIDDFHANLMPEDKINYIKKYLNKKTKLAMVGDGVNDAASLALADVGISMGAIGSDSAIEASDIALMKDDFGKIVEVMALSQRTMRVARQNFLIWGVVNAIGLTLAFSRLIDPQQAAAFNFLTDFFPIFNSLRLFRKTKLN